VPGQAKLVKNFEVSVPMRGFGAEQALVIRWFEQDVNVSIHMKGQIN
jgi:hypothetical protein